MKYWLVGLALVVSLSGCSMFAHRAEPGVAVAGLRMGQGEGLYQTVLVDLVITNPDTAPLKLNAISYRVRVDGRELVAGSSREPLEIAAGANVRYTVPATINLMSGFGFIRDVLMRPKSKIAYELNATLEPAGLFSMPITVRKAETINLAPG